MGMISTIDGINGTLELHDDYIIIKSKIDRFKFVKAGAQNIYLESIKSIRFKEGSTLVHGYIQVETTENTKELSKGSAFAGPVDRFSVIFRKDQTAGFMKMKEMIEKQRRENSKPIIAQNNPVSTADEIRKFADLLSEGLITQEEFDQKKKSLLGL